MVFLILKILLGNYKFILELYLPREVVMNNFIIIFGSLSLGKAIFCNIIYILLRTRQSRAIVFIIALNFNNEI